MKRGWEKEREGKGKEASDKKKGHTWTAHSCDQSPTLNSKRKVCVSLCM